MTDATMTLAEARDLVRREIHDLAGDLSADIDFAETEDFWLIAVNSTNYYKTGLARHALDESRVFAVPKDGSPLLRPFSSGTPIDSQLKLLGHDQTLIDSSFVSRNPLLRVDDSLLFASQSAAVWRSWLPQLRYFALEVRAPHDEGRDAFRATVNYRNAEDAVMRLRALGVRPSARFMSYDLEAVTDTPLTEDHFGWAVTSAGRIYVIVSKSGYLDLRVQGEDHLSKTAFDSALEYEKLFDQLGWADDVSLNPSWHSHATAVTRDRYPELFAT